MTLRLAIRDLIAEHENCWRPCACLRIHNAPSCAALADKIIEAMKAKSASDGETAAGEDKR